MASLDHDPDAKRTQIFWLLFAGYLLLAVFLVAVLARVNYVERESRLAAEQRYLATLSRALEEHVSGSFDSTKLLMRLFQEYVSARGGLARLSQADAHALLKTLAMQLPQARAVYVYDRSLSAFATSVAPTFAKIDGSGFEYLIAHRDHATSDIHIGLPINGAVSGTPNIPVTLRLQGRNGGFDGVIGAALNLDYFGNFYKSLNLEPGVSVALLRDDGNILFGFPDPQSTGLDGIRQTEAFRSSENPHEGSLEIVLPGDTGPRLVAYRHHPRLPLTFVVSRSKDLVLEPWLRTLATRISMLALILAVSGVMLLVFSRQLRRRFDAEEQTLASERKYRSLVEQASVGIFLCGADRRYVDLNQAGLNMLGYSRDEVINRELGAFIDEDELRRMPIRYERLRVGPLEVERRLRHKDGHAIVAEISARMLPNGEILGIVRDVTERNRAQQSLRDSEEELRAIFEGALDGILVAESETRKLLTANPAICSMLGYTHEEIVGIGVSDIHPKRDLPRVIEQFGRLVRGEIQVAPDIPMMRKDGSVFYSDVKAAPIRLGGRDCLLGIFRDNTERKIAAAELMRLNAELEERVAARTEELERANSELNAFSYSVSHDLRAPLRAITGFSTIVMDANRDKLDSESVGQLRRIVAGAQRMTQLIDDLLDLARISRQELHRTNFNLSTLAEQAAQSLIEADPERAFRLMVRPDMRVSGDPSLIRIALDNLLGNACKFTVGTTEARIEVGQEERDGETVFFVRDNGAGFDMQYAGKLFGAFQRLHSDQEFEGTGIGLSIVQRIFTRHGGRVWAEAKVGQGATFYFTFGAP